MGSAGVVALYSIIAAGAAGAAISKARGGKAGKGMIQGMTAGGFAVAGGQIYSTLAASGGSAGAGTTTAANITPGTVQTVAPAHTPAPTSGGLTSAGGGTSLGSLLGTVVKIGGIAQSVASVATALKGPQTTIMPSVESLAPLPLPTGPISKDAEFERVADEAKKAADKRAADIEAGIQADTEAAKKIKRRSLIGLASTIRTSPAGLRTPARVEKKTLLGQGGAFA